MTTRCKFRCTEVLKKSNSGSYGFKKQGGTQPPFLFEAKFSAVIDGSPENKDFYAWTPSGQLSIAVYHEDRFEPGKEYYLDVTEAPAP